MSLGDQIHELRKKHNFSQEQLAEKVGVARQTISKWELGETAPDIKQAQILSQIFNVSLDEMLGNGTKESVIIAHDCKKKNSIPWRKIIAISSVMLLICLVAVGVFGIVRRSQILHPEGVERNVAIIRKNSIRIEQHSAKTIVFNESNKPMIVCELPEGFVADAERSGFYTDENDNFIKFNSDYADNVVNPLLGTDYCSYYENEGYHSYMDMACAAMYYDLPKLGIFSSTEKLHLAGGAQLIREQFCAGQDADYYPIDGGLTEGGDAMRIYGFALHFENTTWMITLKDYKDNYYFITVKDPTGVGKSIDTISEFISYIYAGNAVQYSNILDSVAEQAARNAFMEYMINHISDSGIHGYFVFKADDSRFVPINDGNIEGVYYSIEAALSAMLDNLDPSRLSASDVNDLWIYE